VFIERALRILKRGGILSFINPNKFLSAKYAVALREFMFCNTDFLSLVDVSGIRVFETAAVYPVMIFLRSAFSTAQHDGAITLLLPKIRLQDDFSLSNYDKLKLHEESLVILPEKIWGFLLSRHLKLLTKLIKNSVPLSELGEVNATSTAAESDAFGSLIRDKNVANSVKLVNTGTIDRYRTLWGIRPLTHNGRRLLTPHLALKSDAISERRRVMYKSPKILFSKMAAECEAYPDLLGEYASINTNCFYRPKSGVSLEFVTAICNSRLFMFLYEQFFGALRMSGGYFQFQAPQLRVMLLKISGIEQQECVRLVKRILAAKITDPQADTSKLEAEIDCLVYKLYGLTQEEIAIVENASK
jgi:hypothetical protein